MKLARSGVESRPKNTISWHNLPLGDVFVRLSSKREGLSVEEAAARIKHFGANELIPARARPGWKILSRQFLNPLILILVAAGGLTVFVGSYLDASVIFGAVVLNTLIGFFQESSAEKSLNNLKKLEIKTARARRGGFWRTVPASEIVPGDIIGLKAGDKIPADARLVGGFDLKTDESILTGESAEVVKAAGLAPAEAGIFEQTNVVFGGTGVSDGAGEAVVFGTGENSEIGRISRLIKDLPETPTPFEKKIKKLGRLIGLAVVLASAAILIWGVVLGHEFEEMFLITVAMAVAAIPESLPVAITVILVIGMKRVLKEKGLVRNMAAAENLGGTSVILTDKTGTLTRGEMKVAKVLTPERRSGMLEMDSSAAYVSNHMLVLTYALLVSEAVIENPDDEIHDWVIRGRPVDKALLLAATEAGLDFEKLNQKFKKIGQVTFSSERKFAVSFREDENKERWAIVAGAPEALWGHIKKIQVLNRYENALPFEMAVVKESVDSLARSGLRVIAVAAKKIEPSGIWGKNLSASAIKEIISGLSLAGLVGLKDPIREDVKDFLAMSRRAGIRTVMVTGDHIFTAKTVAREVGLTPKNRAQAEAIEGKDIDSLDAKELAHRVRNVDIFARVTPAQKLKITEAWQSQGELVAVVGDGVNDALALRQADVGVALASGVDLSREASDLILLDNNFSVLVKAVREGRVILENIKKIIAYLLSTSLTEIILVALSLFFGLPIAVTAVQILWVNLVQESLPAIALAMDPAEAEVMDVPPRSPRRPALDAFTVFLVAAIGLVSAAALFLMFVFFKESFGSVGYARSVVFVGLGVSAILFTFSIRSLSKPIWEIRFFETRQLVGSAAAGFALLAAAVYWPPLQLLLKSQPIGFLEWLVVFVVGILNVLLVEAAKWFFIRKGGKML